MPTVEFVRPTGEAKGSINQGGDLKNELRLVTGVTGSFSALFCL